MDKAYVIAAAAVGGAVLLDSLTSHASPFDGIIGRSDSDAGTGEGASVSLATSAAGAVAAVANPALAVNGSLPTAEQRAAVQRKWDSRGRTAGPFQWVPRVRTYPPRGRNNRDLRPYAQAASRVVGSVNGGTIMAILLSLETNAGMNDNPPAFWNNNVGNIKAWSNFNGPVWFIRDRANSLDAYPSWGTLEDGIRDAYRLLSNANYNRSGMKGARRALLDGDMQSFNAALGAGGYARMYRDLPNVFRGRYNYLVRVGALDGGMP